MKAEPITIRDTDLLAQLEDAKGSPGYSLLRESLMRTQAERDESAQLTPVKKRRATRRKEVISKDLRDEDRHHIHSVLALCGLPYRNPGNDVRDYVREYGNNSLAVQSGYLKDPESGRMIAQGLPYGPKARLLMLHLCTMAVRQRSATIEIADSMSAFIRQLGFAVTGGQRGTVRQFKEQLNRLAASRMQIGLWKDQHSTTLNAQPIRSFDIWLPNDPDQKLLWNSTLTLDREFYESLRRHALPVDIRLVRAFTQSAKQIDLLLWLGYRLRSVKRRYPISWSAVKEQFGKDVGSMRKFKQTFSADLKAIAEVYPKLPVVLTEDGIVLSPCDAESLFVPSKRKLGGNPKR